MKKDIVSTNGIKIIKSDERSVISQGGIRIQREKTPIKGELIKVEAPDLTPLTLSIETPCGTCRPLIRRGTQIPICVSRLFATTIDNQPSLEIHVLQGERERVQDNQSLVRFRVDGIPQASRGARQIEVIFNIDTNGILNITAKDKMSARELKVILVTVSPGLSDNEIEKMIRNNSKHKKDRQT